MTEVKGIVRIVIVDDSLAFRWMMRNLLENFDDMEVICEADNGIEALKVIMQSKPDVIMMDLEMPLMDGMTALQHLMIHIPTPTIMFSRLTKEGTARCFDSLKNGAVDFICKDGLTLGRVTEEIAQNIARKVRRAGQVTVSAIEPKFPSDNAAEITQLLKEKIIFCEECGHKKKVTLNKKTALADIICDICGEYLLHEQRTRYMRANCISILLAGEGAYINLLRVIPNLQPDMNGVTLILLDGSVEHVDAFAEYLDSISSIKVIRIQDGLTIEGGACYVGCDDESIYLKPYSAHHTLRCRKEHYGDRSPMDMTLSSISKVFGDRASAIVLSGDSDDGEEGIATLIENKGRVLVLNPENCLEKRMVNNLLAKNPHLPLIPEDELGRRIELLHIPYRDTIVTA